jgi:replicative DNA helicase
MAEDQQSPQGVRSTKNTRERDTRQNNEGLSNYVFGKLPPQALPLEEAVLGALMLDREALPLVMDILQAESFYTDGHQLIYRAVLRLFERGNPIDMLTVTEELKKSGDLDKVGGAYYIVELTNRVASSANIEYHARIIAQKHIQRELIRVSTKVIKDAYEDTTDVFTLLDDAEKGLFNITQNNLSRSYESMGTLSSQVLKQLEDLSKKADGLTGVPTGFTNLDRLTSGWQPSDLIIVAARPGMGKTSFVLAMALNAAKDFNKPVALFSLEMASTQLVTRLISMESEIEGSKMRNGKLEDYEWQQLQTNVERLSQVPIFIDDTPGINIFELRAKCRRLKMQHDIQLVIIDYLQLMTGGGENRNTNREQEISSISRALKNMAKELSVPVIALSQLSRAVEVRGGAKRPQLSDLRECVTGDTLISLCDGTRRKIADCVGEQLDVWTLDTQSQKIVPHRTDLIWEVGEKEVFKVTTKSGRQLRVTAEHRLLTLEGWQIIGTMEPGQRIAAPRHMFSPENTLETDENELIVLAHLIGDGSYLSGQPLRYTTASEDNSKALSDAAQTRFGVRVNRHESGANWHQLVFSGNGNRWEPAGINKWLRDLGIFNQRSHEKQIPAFVFKLSDQQLFVFLRHLWATDGTMYTPQKEGTKTSSKIAFSTNSKTLADDVAHLLLRCGIFARIKTPPQKPQYKTLYSVEVSGVEAQQRFLDTIGSFGAKDAQAALLRAYIANKVGNTNEDIIPQEVFGYAKEQMKNLGISHRKMAEQRGTAYGGKAHFAFAPSRDVLNEYAELLDDPYLQALADSDIFWDTIKTIEHDGCETVYDLSVPDYHAWIANDIFSHNSGAIEQDADLVSFIYRPEYYQILEDENGQSLKGVAEFIVAKHRNGATDTIKLKFTDKFAKFGNLDDPHFAGLDLAGPFTSATVVPSRMNDEDIPF